MKAICLLHTWTSLHGKCWRIRTFCASFHDWQVFESCNGCFTKMTNAVLGQVFSKDRSDFENFRYILFTATRDRHSWMGSCTQTIHFWISDTLRDIFMERSFTLLIDVTQTPVFSPGRAIARFPACCGLCAPWEKFRGRKSPLNWRTITLANVRWRETKQPACANEILSVRRQFLLLPPL